MVIACNCTQQTTAAINMPQPPQPASFPIFPVFLNRWKEESITITSSVSSLSKKILHFSLHLLALNYLHLHLFGPRGVLTLHLCAKPAEQASLQPALTQLCAGLQFIFTISIMPIELRLIRHSLNWIVYNSTCTCIPIKHCSPEKTRPVHYKSSSMMLRW